MIISNLSDIYIKLHIRCRNVYFYLFILYSSGNVASAVTVDGCMKEYHGCNAVFYKFVNGIKINCHTGLPFDDRLGF